MKKIRYEVKEPKGVLLLTVPSVIPEEKVIYECDCAYSAWCDTDEDDDNFLDLPEYMVGCLQDSGIVVVMFEFVEEEE